jgi:release factor glutamine methyltransferase
VSARAARTPRQLIDAAADRLRAAGVPAPELDAEALLRHVLGWDRARLVAEATTPLGQDAEAAALARFARLVTERAARRPLQHLTGRQWFWRHEFVVTKHVLIPRPETELIVEEGLRRLKGLREPVVVDVGTGGGCIALSIAAERPDAEVVGIDLSSAALAVATENARRMGLERRVRFLEGDLLEPVAALHGRIDLVASNPPYVDAADVLAPEVRDHEPALALFPPGDPQSVYRRLLPQAATALRPGGALLLEVGRGMADAVAALCETAGLRVEAVLADLQAIPRTVVARRP